MTIKMVDRSEQRQPISRGAAGGARRAAQRMTLEQLSQRLLDAHADTMQAVYACADPERPPDAGALFHLERCAVTERRILKQLEAVAAHQGREARGERQQATGKRQQATGKRQQATGAAPNASCLMPSASSFEAVA